MASQTIPKAMLCDNRECQHPLSDHLSGPDEVREISVQNLKTSSFPCYFFDRSGVTFAVCACRDFELPALGTEGKAAETPDEPIHSLTLEGDILLILWASGRVPWDPK